ncbi:preprotein translocase subunit SecE [Fusobacterium sp.]|uniref:preprotein translocase subunit SecE n=1 Tax=Fusobacterium sp. TaxID=68766 RepID=UPI00261A0F16|nr:preprotein translocase subunit SecE [Fusobacterium sp.]
MKLLKDVKMEYSKVEWPRKKQVIHATVWVAVMSVALSIYLGVFDIVVLGLLKRLVSLFGGQ